MTGDRRGGAPTTDDIRAAIDRITLSDVFARSPQLSAFLRFVTEAVLQGKADRIKAYTIGIEVLRRDTRFDPQLDPIVRVEATRLRRALERYYAGPGADDLIVIDLPRGSYVPTFTRREIEQSRAALLLAAVARRSAPWLRPPARTFLAMACAGAAAALVGLFLVSRTYAPAPGEATVSRDAAAALGSGNGMPNIYIEPPRVIGAPAPGGQPADILYEKINDAFARFDTINVVSAKAQSTAAADASAAPGAAEPRSDYRLSSVVEYGNGLTNAWFKLIDSAEGNVVWSRTFERRTGATESGPDEQAIVVALTNSLLQSYGVIRARDRARQLASSSGDPRYRCVLEAADAIRTADRREFDLARACLEHLTALDPSFAVGFTFLALIYNREFQLGYEPRAGDPPPLDRALRAVRQAIALHPESSRGYLALMVVQFNRRDIAAALAAGDKCLTLNRYDMLALGEFGGRLILAGDIDRGLKMLREAGAQGAVRPSWHYIYLSIGDYISGNLAQAAEYARQIPDDNVALGQVAKALVAKADGDGPGARQAIDRLLALQPAWRENPRHELARLIADAGIVDRLTRDLAAAGLPGGT